MECVTSFLHHITLPAPLELQSFLFPLRSWSLFRGHLELLADQVLGCVNLSGGAITLTDQMAACPGGFEKALTETFYSLK